MDVLTIVLFEALLLFSIIMEFIIEALAICGITLIAVLIIAKVSQKKDKWISCSKRLPGESDYYFACIYNADVDDFDFRKTWFAHVDDYDMEESEWRELYDFETVTAWQPLPEAYKPKVKKRYKITATLNYGYTNREGVFVQPKKTVYAKYSWTKNLKVLYLSFFYDWVDVEEEVIES